MFKIPLAFGASLNVFAHFAKKNISHLYMQSEKTYSQKYYENNREKFKIYYNNAKAKRLAIANGTWSNEKKLMTKEQKIRRRYEKQLRIIEERQRKWREENPDLVRPNSETAEERPRSFSV